MSKAFSHQVVLVAILAFIFSTVNAQVAPPQIQTVNMWTYESAKATWTTDAKIQPSRYRVQLTSDTSPTPVEWPCQVRKVRYDSEDAPYKQMNTKSNYECFNHCIQDPECNFVVRSSNPTGDNCFLKKNDTESLSPIEADSEYAVIDPYSNSTLINYISPNQLYQVKLAVYDTVLEAWSDFSISTYFSFPPSMRINFVRSGVTSGSLQLQNQRGFAYSRFGILASANQSSSSEIMNLNTSSLITYQHPSGYFYIEDYSKFTVALSDQECIDECFSDFECVQLVYFSEDFDSSDGTKIASKNSCYLNKKMDVYNGIYRTTNTTVLTVEDKSAGIDLNNTEFGSWTFLLETWTTYGVKSNSSAKTIYNITDASPILKSAAAQYNINITWQMPEPLAVKRSALYYTVNDSSTMTYAISASTDFIDPKQKIVNVSTFNECFETCYKSQECLAYTYAGSECFMKTTTANPAPCANTSICGFFPNPVVYDFSLNWFINSIYCFYAYATTTFDYTTPPGRLICMSNGGTVKIEQTDTFYPGRMGRLRCFPRDYNKKINWYKDFKPLDLSELNANISDDKTMITFYNITAGMHNGVYSCENILNNTQVVPSSNFAIVKVNETVPGYVNIVNITLMGTKDNPSVLIQWDIDPFIQPTNCLNLYYSSQSNNGTKMYCSPTLRGGSIIINERFDCSYIFKMELINSIGTGPMSNTFSIPNSECKDSPVVNPPKTYFVAFIVSCVVAGVLLIAAVGMLINRCKSNQISSSYSPFKN